MANSYSAVSIMSTGKSRKEAQKAQINIADLRLSEFMRGST
jgi:hypothetical protein